ncbi:MAG: hypothetical protein AAB388_04270 [Patescibacteria group bacterium]
MKVEAIIRNYLEDIVHMSIATSHENKPWISEVHYSYDDELNFYFVSRPNRRHSVEVSQNNQIAGNIVRQHKKDESVRGVYFEGLIEMLHNVTKDQVAFQTYNQRFNSDASILEEQSEEDGHRWYKIVVQKFYLFDELEMNPAGKYELGWKTL